MAEKTFGFTVGSLVYHLQGTEAVLGQISEIGHSYTKKKLFKVLIGYDTKWFTEDQVFIPAEDMSKVGNTFKQD